MNVLRNRTSLIATALIAGLTLTGIAMAEPTKEGKPQRQKGGEDSAKVAKEGPRARRQAGAPGVDGPRPGRDGANELIKFWGNDRVAERLELTDDQIKGLEMSFETSKGALDALKDDGKEAHEALRAELEKDNPNLDSVLAADTEITAINTQRRKILLTHQVAVQSILTPDQEAALKKARNHMGRQRGQRGPGLEGGPGGEMRERLAGVETVEELNAALDEAGVPAENRERIIQMWERRKERGGRPGPDGPPPMDDEGGAMPLPPLPEEGL